MSHTGAVPVFCWYVTEFALARFADLSSVVRDTFRRNMLSVCHCHCQSRRQHRSMPSTRCPFPSLASSSASPRRRHNTAGSGAAVLRRGRVSGRCLCWATRHNTLHEYCLRVYRRQHVFAGSLSSGDLDDVFIPAHDRSSFPHLFVLQFFHNTCMSNKLTRQPPTTLGPQTGP
ncbi:hypothetical protein B0H19DRAFT_314781 [Mycena capillaripes]|nr:hypothetical protein B0H19DRAFT_314781 [Mycena capillaripes]